MPLPLPVLDDRTYQDLLDEVVEQIPVFAPDWTDQNASDPGITLLELFAYLAEQTIYRANRIPDRQYRALLRLLGCVPRRAQVALTPVRFSLQSGVAAIDLPADIQIGDAKGSITFQTGPAFHISDAELKTVLTSRNNRFIDRTQLNATLASTFAPFGDRPQVDDALYLGFDRALGPADSVIRLFAFGASAGDDWNTWRALIEEWKRNQTLRVCRSSCRPERKPWEHYSVRVTWECFDGTGWQPLPNIRDFTRALSISGPVRWHSPAAAAHKAGGVANFEDLFFVRCRVVDGAYDCAPMIRGVWVNTLVARHAADMGDPVALAGCGTGRALQSFRLTRAPVVPNSTVLFVNDAKGPTNEIWRERSDVDRSGAHARDYVLDTETGEITFGDGREGRVLASGRVLNATWKVGGGATGNVPTNTIDTLLENGINVHIPNWSVVRPTLQVDQPLSAIGGADAESLDETKARAFQKISAERCATTLADFERIALLTPGVPVALAYAVAEHHPKLGCLPVEGCLSIVIVPKCVNVNRDPTQAMCAAVEAFVAPRRPVALEVHVTGPHYTVVSVEAKLALAKNANRALVFAQAKAALKQYLDPLQGGPKSAGWPVGRTVYRSELLALLDAIDGVSYVGELTLTSDDDAPDHCGDIPICANGLVISGEHSFSTIQGTRS